MIQYLSKVCIYFAYDIQYQYIFIIKTRYICNMFITGIFFAGEESDLNLEDDEKQRFIRQVLDLQNTLDGLQ